MNRMKILQSYREKVIRQLAIESENRAKWLAELIDIDDELEELSRVWENENSNVK